MDAFAVNNLDVCTDEEAVTNKPEYQHLVKAAPFIIVHKPSCIMLSLSLFKPEAPRVDMRLISQPRGQQGDDGCYRPTKYGFYFPVDYLPEFLNAVRQLLHHVKQWKAATPYLQATPTARRYSAAAKPPQPLPVPAARNRTARNNQSRKRKNTTESQRLPTKKLRGAPQVKSTKNVVQCASDDESDPDLFDEEIDDADEDLNNSEVAAFSSADI
ncbi:uncharacterized protein LOC129602210 [Paramacrobiotus metropolitanus]|uniref:uncharacterized protein LOC129602210 n=1 Tax=Paramacrobiotus metropolitanus TaxID=2943436 RepID=UPI0024464941|nr:uncharacterized protein LOC129602210 [Paramacrobiotus metropolitanus]